MGCNCNKKKSRPYGPVTPKTEKPEEKKQKFTLTDRNGKTQEFGSKLERDAAARRMTF